MNYFLAISEARSFSRAATSLRLTQPALSRRIRELEAELGASLFERHGRGVTLTEAGTLLHERATGILRLAGAAKEEIAAHTREPSGDLAVALPAAYRVLITAKLLANYNRLYPKVRLRVLELTTVGRQEAVVAGRADLAVITSVDPDEGLVVRPLVNEALFIVGAPERGLRASRSECLKDIAKLPLVQNTRPNGMRLILEKAISRAGFENHTVMEVDAIGMMIDLAAAGPYCAVAPFSAIQNHVEAQRVSAAPIAGLAITWQVVAASDRPISVAARAFEEMLVFECRTAIHLGKWKTGKLIYQ